MLYYEDERAALERQAVEATPLVDLSIAYSPVIAFPLTIAGVGVERMLDPVPVIQTVGGLYLVQTPFHDMLMLGNPLRADLLATMRARFLIVRGWYDSSIDLLPYFERDRVIAQFFDGAYLYLGPQIQYRKRGQEAPPGVVEAWEREVAQRSLARNSMSVHRPIAVRPARPSPAEMKQRVLLAAPEELAAIMESVPGAVVVDVRASYPGEQQLRSAYGGRYFRQGSWWKPTREGLENPEQGIRQILPLLETGKTVVLYCSCPAEQGRRKKPCHRIMVRDYVLAALDRREAEEEAARLAATQAISASAVKPVAQEGRQQ